MEGSSTTATFVRSLGFWFGLVTAVASVFALWGTLGLWMVVVFILPFLSHFVFKAVQVRATRALPTPDRWEARINESLRDVNILGIVDELPVINIIGEYPLTPEQIKLSKKQSYTINDNHAILDDLPYSLSGRVEIICRSLDFAKLTALRHTGFHGYILSACAVLICPEARKVILHVRAGPAFSATYDSTLHTFGGGFQPGKDSNLLHTARREVDEECRAVILNDGQIPPMLLSVEEPTKFLQLTFLGATISRAQMENLEHYHWESLGIEKVDFDALDSFLMVPSVRLIPTDASRTTEWVPSGRAQVLAWLALGAPGIHRNAKFNGRTAHELFNWVLR